MKEKEKKEIGGWSGKEKALEDSMAVYKDSKKRSESKERRLINRHPKEKPPNLFLKEGESFEF